MASKPFSPAAIAVGSLALVAAGAFAYRSFAAPAATAPAEADDDSTTALARILGAYTSGAMSPEVMRQKIANYQRMLQTPGLHHVVPGDVWYQNEIAKMQARLTSLQTGQEQTAVWRSLGQTATGVGILAGISLALYLGVRAYQEAKE